MNIVITGVSKGIGLALTETSLKHGHKVYGIVRNPDASAELSKLKQQFPEALHLIKVDLTASNAGPKILQELGKVTSLDLLINNAGIYEEGSSRDEFLKSFEVNSYVPFMVTDSVLSLLKKGQNPKAIHITSQMGSIKDNSSGGAYAYRASKAALNMINKSLSVDHPWLICAVIHPGWVQTSMGGDNAPTTPEESARGIWHVIESLNLKDTGSFRTFQGKELPW